MIRCRRRFVYPSPVRHLLAWGAFAFVALAFSVALSGCAVFVPAEVKTQIRKECAIHDGVLRLWPKLSDEQKLRAYRMSRANWYAQRKSVLGDELPDDLLPESDEMKRLRHDLGLRPYQNTR